MTVLCRLADLEATGAKELTVDDAGIKHAIFVVRHDGGVKGYFNACPHARLPLNNEPDRFLDIGGSFLVCVNHGAHFDVMSGLCFRGVCKGASLKNFPVRLEGDNIIATDPDFTL